MALKRGDVIPQVAIAPARYVRIGPITEALTGISEKAQKQKIASKAWMQGHEWIKGPDGRQYLDVDGYNAWVESGK